MELEGDGVVRNNGPPIIGILKYYALVARRLLLRSDPESCWSVRARSYRIGITVETAEYPSTAGGAAALFIARCKARHAMDALSFGRERSDLYVGKFVAEKGRRKMGRGGKKRTH